jgi:hypothetical protein
MKQVRHGSGKKLRRLDAAIINFTSVHDFGVQMPLNVDRSAISQLLVFGNNADQRELFPAKQPAFLAQAINQAVVGLGLIGRVAIDDHSQDFFKASEGICNVLDLGVELLNRFAGSGRDKDHLCIQRSHDLVIHDAEIGHLLPAADPQPRRRRRKRSIHRKRQLHVP